MAGPSLTERPLTLLQWSKYLGPQIVILPYGVGDGDVCHAGIRPSLHSLELADEVGQGECLANSLSCVRLESDGDNV